MKKDLQGILALVGATCIYGLFPVMVRLAGFSMPFFFQNASRLLVAFLVFLAGVILFKKWKKVKRADYKWFILRAVAVFLAFSFFTLSLNFIPIGTTLFSFYAGSTVVGYLIGAFFFHEKLTSKKVFSLILAIVGLLMIYSLDIKAEKALYVAMAFASGSFTAIWNIFSKKVVETYHSFQLNLIDNAIAGVLALVVSLVLREQWITPSLSFVWAMNVLFGLGIVATDMLIVYGFSRLEAQIGSLIMLTEVLFAIAFGFLFFRESVTLITLFGGSIILAAIIIPELKILMRKR